MVQANRTPVRARVRPGQIVINNQQLRDIKIKALLDANFSVAKKLKCGFHKVLGVKNAGSPTSGIQKRKRRSDAEKSRTITAAQKAGITRRLRNRQYGSVKAASRATEINRCAIRRHLKTKDWGVYVKPVLTPNIRQVDEAKRVDFANKVLEKAAELEASGEAEPGQGRQRLLELIMFTDEAPGKHGESNNRHNSGTYQSRDRQKPTLKRQRNVGREFTFCGGISMAGATDLKLFGPTETIRMEEYCEVLQFYKDQAQKCFKEDDMEKWLLIEDNAPAHASYLAAEFRLENGIRPVLPVDFDARVRLRDGSRRRSVGIKFQWPPNSPDLNPIENWWSMLKENVAKRSPTTAAQAERYIHSEHAKMITNGYARKMCEGWMKRIDLVIENGGKYIGY